MRRIAALAALAMTPLLLAAADPRGDTGPCSGNPGQGDERIDLVRAGGTIVEDGDAIRWTLRFARPLPVPDTERKPLRVDIVIRDPSLPTVSFHYYRDLNRIVRFDDVPQPLLQIVLIPEHGANVFEGATVAGDRLTVEVPGRIIVRDQDLKGLGLRRLRWSVIARDEGTCDFLGDGRPTHRLGIAPPEPAPSTPPPVTTSRGGGFSDGLRAALIAGAVLVLGIAVAALAAVRRRRDGWGSAADGEPLLLAELLEQCVEPGVHLRAPPLLPLVGQRRDRVVVGVLPRERLGVLGLDPRPVVLLPEGDAPLAVVPGEPGGPSASPRTARRTPSAASRTPAGSP